LLSIVNDILDFSKIEAGRMELDETSFVLEAVVFEAVDLVAVRAAEQGIDLLVRVDPDCPEQCVGDAGRIRQVLLNLLSNAVKFTKKGYVLVEVGVAGNRVDDTRIRFSVVDTGIGIPEGRIADLFEAFTQADASTTRKYGGTGLGLAISKRLVQLMGGEIDARSVVGEGSTFAFDIPLRVGAESAAPNRLALTPFDELRALVVDGEGERGRIVSDLLESWRMCPVAAPTAEAARDTLEREPVSLIIAHWSDELPVAALTGHAALIVYGPITQRWRAEATGARFVTQPIQASALHDAIAGVLAKEVEPPVGAEPMGPASRLLRIRARTAVASVHGTRVLVAEDNAVNQKVATRMLERLGYRVDVVANGIEAVEAVGRVPYRVVLMDCQMPEMDGYAATAAIRERYPERPIWIIAMTANAMQGDQERCLAAGMDDYVSKPVQLETLRDVLGRRAGSSTREDDAAQPLDALPHDGDAAGPADAIDADRIRELGLLEPLPGEPGISELFRTDGSALIRTIQDGLDCADLDQVRRAAHTLKGSSANLGASALAEAARVIERAGADGDLTPAPAALESARVQFERVVRALTALEAA
jgi:CheY-like chemotaxis protein